MGLEAGEFIKDLVANWPLPTDKRREGDDHLRLIKKVLKNTFPNLNAAVTATPAVLNNLPANTASLVTELKKHLVPARTVVAFSGEEEQIPDGWVLCDGRTVAGFGAVPDLRARFLFGANATYHAGTLGGASSANSSTSGGHVHTVQSVVLGVAQLPAHSHRIYGSSHGGEDNDPITDPSASVVGNADATGAYTSTNGSATKIVEDTGGNQGHTHGMEAAGVHQHTVSTLPPFYAIAYIIKVVDWVEPA